MITELEQNKQYTKKDILEFMNLTENQWKKNRQKYLKHLSKFYKFEIIKDPNDRRKILFRIIIKIKNYEPLLSKSKERKIILKNKVYNVLSNNNIQTGASIFRKIKNDTDIISLNYKESTLQNYIYDVINELKESGTIILIKKEWMGIDNQKNYNELNDEQRSELSKLFEKYYDKSDTTITEYLDIADRFVMLTDLYPIKVPVYDVGVY